MFRALLREIKLIGYDHGRIKENYEFTDVFNSGTVIAPAVAFGRLPPDSDTACIAIALSNGEADLPLISRYRALGAPRAFEVRDDRVIDWRVSASPTAADKQNEILPNEIESVFQKNASRLAPESLLRAKSIGPVDLQQRDFIDFGLIPALEANVREKLGPILSSTLFDAQAEILKRTGQQPDYDRLFRLIFRALIAKTMHDKGLMPGVDVSMPRGPSVILDKIAEHYKDYQPIIKDPVVQRIVFSKVWSDINFSNLSVKVLAFIWENFLITDEIRQARGIHATPAEIARFVADRLVSEPPPSTRRVVEPCCGSGTFLISSLQRLRELLPESYNSRDRHRYFAKVLAGFDEGVFALEIARACLTLADLPEPNGWYLKGEDVFDSPLESPQLTAALSEARFVMCNPPFENFTEEEQEQYDPVFVQKPAEMLNNVLERMPSDGEIGFVLPRQAVDGRAYRPLRAKLAERFKAIQVVQLPEGVFENARFPTILLIAKSPSVGHETVQVDFARVSDVAQFLHAGVSDWRQTLLKSLKATEATLGNVELSELWDYLAENQQIANVADDVARGVEWQNYDREKHISDEAKPGFVPGFHKADGMFCFEPPPVMFLYSRKDARRRNAWDKPWKRAKVICNAVRKSAGPWRISACSVDLNLLCSQNFTVIWPKAPWTSRSLAAVMNGPVACAFASTHEGWKHLRKETLEAIPIPPLDTAAIAELDSMVAEYENLAALRRDFPPSEGLFEESYPSEATLRSMLGRIDRFVLSAYNLPAALLAELTSYFDDNLRPVPFRYGISDVANADKATKESVLAERGASWKLLKAALERDRLSHREKSDDESGSP